MERARKWLYYSALLSAAALPTVAQAIASDAYTPIKVQCPEGSLVRSAGTGSQTLSAAEAAYISERESTILPSAWSTYLTTVKTYAAAHKLDVPTYVQQLLGGKEVPQDMRVGMAVSGGGYRAAVVGGGIMHAFDGRNVTSVHAGTGGLLQGVSYLSGLSGGGWLVSSLTQTGFPTVPDLIWGTNTDHSKGDTGTYGGFLAQFGFVEPSSNVITDGKYALRTIEETDGKKAAGFNITMTDWWARVLARHFINGTSAEDFFDYDIKHGAGTLWSDAPKQCVLITSYWMQLTSLTTACAGHHSLKPRNLFPFLSLIPSRLTRTRATSCLTALAFPSPIPSMSSTLVSLHLLIRL